MPVDMKSLDAARPAGSTPIVEPDGAGGHVPYVRLDTTPTTDYSAAETVMIALLRGLLLTQQSLLDEARAARLAIEDLLNQGSAGPQTDYLEMAFAIREETGIAEEY